MLRDSNPVILSACHAELSEAPDYSIKTTCFCNGTYTMVISVQNDAVSKLRVEAAIWKQQEVDSSNLMAT